MTRLLAIFAWVFGSGLVLLLGLAAYISWSLDLNDHKERLEDVLGEALGLEVEIRGKVGHRWSAGLSLYAHGIIARQGGETVAVIDDLQVEPSLSALLERQVVLKNVRARIRSIDAIWDAQGVLNLAPRLTAPRGLTPADPGASDWIQGARIHGLTVEIGQGRYLDLVEGYDLAAKDALVRLSALPILDRGQIMVGTPRLFMEHAFEGEARADRFEIGALLFEGLELEARNERGVIAVGRLASRRVRDVRRAVDRSAGVLEGIDLEAAGRLRFWFGDPPDPPLLESWSELAGLDLETPSFRLEALHVRAGAVRFVLKDVEFETRGLPLVRDGTALVRLLETLPETLLTGAPFHLGSRGSSVSAGSMRLEDYELALEIGEEGLAATLARGRLALGTGRDAASSGALATSLKGEALLATGKRIGEGSGRQAPPVTLTAKKLRLDGGPGALQMAQSNYRFDALSLDADGLPLVIDGRFLDFSRLEDLITALASARVALEGRGITHYDGALDSLSFVLVGQGDRLVLEDLLARLESTSLAAEGEADLGGDLPPWRLGLTGEGVSVSPLLAWFEAPFKARGQMNLSIDLRGSGFDLEQLAAGLGGRVRMDAEKLDVDGVDLDKLLTHLENTQDGGLLDIGAFALAGPAGPLLVTTADYVSLVDGAGARGSSRVLAMRSELLIDRGMVHIQDVAMATRGHRLAIKGSLSTEPDGPLDLQIATLDSNGCPIYLETIGGTVAEPTVSEASLLVKTFGRPVQSVISVLGEILPLPCGEPFYTGAVNPQQALPGDWRHRDAEEGERIRPSEPPPTRESPRNSPDTNLFLDHDF